MWADNINYAVIDYNELKKIAKEKGLTFASNIKKELLVSLLEALPNEWETTPETKPTPEVETKQEIKPSSDSPTYQEGVKPKWPLNEKQMRDYLMSFPKVRVLVPLGAWEKKGETECVLVNWVRLDIKKGAMVDIPSPFADQIFSHFQIIDTGKEIDATNKALN